jgi:hypothetical protein
MLSAIFFFLFFQKRVRCKPPAPRRWEGAIRQKLLSPPRYSLIPRMGPQFPEMGPYLDRPDPITRPQFQGMSFVFWQIGQFQFANMGPDISPMVRLCPFSCGFDYYPIAAGATPAIRHTRGRQLLRLSPTIPTVVRRARRSSPLPAPALWAIGPRQPPHPPIGNLGPATREIAIWDGKSKNVTGNDRFSLYRRIRARARVTVIYEKGVITCHIAVARGAKADIS